MSNVLRSTAFSLDDGPVDDLRHSVEQELWTGDNAPSFLQTENIASLVRHWSGLSSLPDLDRQQERSINDAAELLMPVSDSIARKGLPHGTELDDAKSAGYIGLLQVVQRVDSAASDDEVRGFLTQRVRGEVIDSVRSYSALSRKEIALNKVYLQAEDLVHASKTHVGDADLSLAAAASSLGIEDPRKVY